jgi:ribosome-associated heat shock protein Hsp15
MTEHPDKIRLDKWLWAARFYKTRSQATDAINGGKVHADGERVKPGREARVGMRLNIHAHGTDWEIEIMTLSGRRGPAPEARLLYRETDASIANRERLAEQRKQQAILHGDRHGRPTKRDRRAIIRFTRRSAPD